MHFDDVRPEVRTPSYSPDSRTDLVLAQPEIAVVVKYIGPGLRESQLAKQWAEDVAYYQKRGGCRALIGLAYDPESLLVDLSDLEAMGRRESTEDMETRVVMAR